MKQVVRNPMRFEALNLLALHGREHSVSIMNSATRVGLLARMGASLLEALEDDALLYGQRTEAMFQAMVASLGHFQVLKQEDVGDTFVADVAMQIPDFRLILPDGTPLLIEVKNLYQDTHVSRPFVMKATYLDGLLRYAKAMQCELKIAIYWSTDWNLWSLVRPEVFHEQGKRMVLSMNQALLASEMRILGDRWIGTAFPLRIRFHADPTQPRFIDKRGQAQFVIDDVELSCSDHVIMDKLEQQIALYLMMYGGWQEEAPVHIMDDQLDYFDIEYFPPEDSRQGFALVGSLSRMFCTAYNSRTLEGGKVQQLQVDTTPGFLSHLMLGQHTRNVLPLWIFDVQPDFSSLGGAK